MDFLSALAVDLVDRMNLGVAVWRLNGPEHNPSLRLVFANAASASLLGTDLSDQVGERMEELLRGDPAIREYIGVIRSGERREFKRIASDSEGLLVQRVLSVKALPLSSDCMATVFEDVTGRESTEQQLRQLNDALESRIQARTAELVRANEALREGILQRELAERSLQVSEEQLRQAQKMESIGRLAGGIAHDFNNMLSVILSYSAMIKADADPSTPLWEDIEQIRLAAERSSALTQQLLAFSRRQVSRPRPLKMNQVVRSIEKMVARLIGEDVELSLDLTPDDPQVAGDPVQLDQVLMNLAVNARDAMPDGGCLTLRTALVQLDEAYSAAHPGVAAGSYVMLSVGDTGVGMSAATLANAFEPFFTTKTSGKGTGLGLATVYGIIKQSKGTIEVDSELGRGTVFRMYLPRLEGAVEEVAVPAISPQATGGRETILLVEDNDLVRRTAHSILEDRGYNVLIARCAADAISICREHRGPIDLVLTDVVMPQMSGPEMVQHIAPLLPGTPVLFMSGYTDGELGRHGVLEQGVQFLAKPFTAESMATRVREVLEDVRARGLR